jgi:hypothetical protein
MVRLAADAIGPDARAPVAICPDTRAGGAAICADERPLATGWEPVGRAGGVAKSSMSESSPV